MSEDPERRLAAIVSADVVGYSRLMGLDEVGTLESLRTHRRELIDPKIAEHGGRIAKTMGDGLLLEFPSVVAAVKCAMAMQNGMVARNADMSDDAAIRFRVGIHLGDVIIDGDDIHGDGVNIAARVQEVAEPDGICVTADVYRQVETRLGVSFASLGDRTLKNIAQPVGLYALRLERDGEQQSKSPDLSAPDPSQEILY
ncbi:MAG: adenylate/guanylate cyclase domain-containing protein [Alphaproteobacteria bacterium]|jgi:adenylate cyclase|nr:adenylate/guanylate cyclase domain-containing protein [Alphaproteobacteria bacterium]